MSDARTEKLPFSSFADPSWFKGNDGSSVRLRFFRIGKVPYEFIGRYLTDFPTSYFTQNPVRASVVVMEDFNFSDLRLKPTSNSDGMMVFKAGVCQREVQGGAMLVLAAPEKIDGASVDGAKIARSLDVVQATISLHLGSCFFFEDVLETTIDMQSGSHSVASDPVKVFSTGPYLSTNRWKALHVFAEKLERGELKGRVEFALERLALALRRGGDFLDYWIALEVLCNGKAAAIRARLARAYSLSRPHDVDKEFGFNFVALARHGLVHHGKNVSFSPAFEEYMNAVFLDILCYELGIPEVGHLRRILRRDNHDLTFIGRTSNRSASTSISDELDVVQGRERERERVLKEWERQLRSVGL